MSDFVTVAVFSYPQEMSVLRAHLEAEGIRCFAQDENTISVYPLYSNLVGGIKLQVPAVDVARAREMLKEWGYTSSASTPPTDQADELQQWTRDLFMDGKLAGPRLRLPSIPIRTARLIFYALIGATIVFLVLLS